MIRESSGMPSSRALSPSEREARLQAMAEAAEKLQKIAGDGEDKEVLTAYFESIGVQKNIAEITPRDLRGMQEFAEQNLIDTGRPDLLSQRLLVIALSRLLDLQGVPSTPNFRSLDESIKERKEIKKIEPNDEE